MEREKSRMFGYARVSSREQNLDRQILELKKYVPKENIVIDKQSGKDLKRPGYQALKGALGLRKGDTLYVKSLDRLSRNKNDIKGELKYFQDNGIRLMVLDLPTTMVSVPDGQEWIVDMINNILIEVIASMAEQERLTIRKRQREGIEAAKRKGKHLGRPSLEMPEMWQQVYFKWKNGEITVKRATEILQISRSSFYRLAKKEENSEKTYLKKEGRKDKNVHER